jgi:hypothetical protein
MSTSRTFDIPHTNIPHTNIPHTNIPHRKIRLIWHIDNTQYAR